MSAANRIHRNKLARVTICGVLAGVALLGAAAPAHAGGWDFSINIGNSHRAHREHIVVRHRPVCVSHEFSRGMSAGERAGFDAGFQDGLRGRCCEPKAASCHGSREFREGFAAGFTKAYRAGFERGSCERDLRRHRLRCR